MVDSPSPIGTYEVVASATDAAENTGLASTTLTVIDASDTEAPDVTIASPADNAVIGAPPVDVVGTASDTNLVYYVLEAAPVGSDQFTEMFRGTTSVIDDVLGKFDTSGLSNGSYRLRLSAILLGSCPAFLKDFKNALCSSASKSLTEVGLSVTRCWRSATRHPNTAPTTYAGQSHHEKLVPSRLAPTNVERIACSQGRGPQLDKLQRTGGQGYSHRDARRHFPTGADQQRHGPRLDGNHCVRQSAGGLGHTSL